jgi:hypothetical protein
MRHPIAECLSNAFAVLMLQQRREWTATLLQINDWRRLRKLFSRREQPDCLLVQFDLRGSSRLRNGEFGPLGETVLALMASHDNRWLKEAHEEEPGRQLL